MSNWREKQQAQQQEKAFNAASAKQILVDGDNVQQVEVLLGKGFVCYGQKRDIVSMMLPNGGMMLSIKKGWLDNGVAMDGSMDVIGPFIIRNIKAPPWWDLRDDVEPEEKKEGSNIIV